MVDAITVVGVEAWQRLVSQMFVPLNCRALDPGFTASVTQRRIADGMWVSRLICDAHEAERSPGLIAEDASAELLVLMQLRGESRLMQRGRAAVVPAGSLAICETDAPYRIHARTGGQELLILQLSRSHTGLPDRLTSLASARRIDSGVPGQVALRALLYGLQAPQLTLSGGTGAGLVHAVSELLATVVRALLTRDAAASVERAEVSRAVLLTELRTTLRGQLSDPGLTVERLAAQHYLSVRHVYALFAEASDSPAAYLRRARLEHASRLLADRGHSGVTVRSVSMQSGYSDAAAFIRAFTRERGCSPARWAERVSLTGTEGPAIEV